MSPEEDAESSVWNNMIAPRLQQLESVAAGSLGNAIRKPILKSEGPDQTHSFNPKNVKILLPTTHRTTSKIKFLCLY